MLSIQEIKGLSTNTKRGMYATVQGLCYYSVSSIADPNGEESPSVVFLTTPLVVVVLWCLVRIMFFF